MTLAMHSHLPLAASLLAAPYTILETHSPPPLVAPLLAGLYTTLVMPYPPPIAAPPSSSGSCAAEAQESAIDRGKAPEQ
ncbi:unnamed protein product [Victoria cruziana]